MGRGKVFHANLTDDYDQVSEQNRKLVDEYIKYLKSNDRSTQSIIQYTSWLKVFFCWNKNHNEDKFFIDLKKRDFVYYIGYLRELGLSSHRIAGLKSVLSAMSNAIELLYEDEYPDFKNRLKGLEAVHIENVREKTVISDEELDNMLKTLVDEKQYQEACYIALGAFSGSRKAELLQMKASFFVDENIVFNGQFWQTPKIRGKGRGKNGKMQHKFVLKSLFAPYLKLWLEERQRLGVTIDDLFVVKKNEQYIPAGLPYVNSIMKRLTQKFNINCYSHMLRHKFTTYLRKKNIPDNVITFIFSWNSSEMCSVYDDTPETEKMTDFFNNFNIAKDDKVKEGNLNTLLESGN